MKRVILLLLTIFAVQLTAQQPVWLRYSSISPDGQTIVFAYQGDLYKVPAKGGQAIPLTFHSAYDYMPVWSHDGKTIAFASDRFGNFDIFTIPAQGGEVTRLTYHSANEYPYDFTHDNRQVIFGATRQDLATHRQYPTGSQPETYTVPVTGGRVDMLWTFPAEAVQVSKDGNQMAYHDKKGGENEFRKHHVSGMARDLWIADMSSGKQTMITTFGGEDRNPVFAGNGVLYYLSEQSGSFNVHVLNISSPAQTRQITHFKEFPVRNLSISDDGLLCFSYNGKLYTLKPGSEPLQVPITVLTETKANTQSFVPVTDKVTEISLSPNGKELAFISRGEVFVSSVEGAVTKRITNTPGVERFLSFAPDGETLLFSTQRDGQWNLAEVRKSRKNEPFFYASTLLDEKVLFGDKNDRYLAQYSPNGKEIAFIENRNRLVVYNIDSKTPRTLLTSAELFYMQDGDQYFEWSPDGKWLLVQFNPQMANGEVGLIQADGKGSLINLTQSGYDDMKPKWVNNGRQIIWFSNRDGMRSYATSGAKQSDVYTMFFTQDAWDKFRLSKEDYALVKAIEEKDKKKEEPAKTTDKKKEPKKDSLNVELDLKRFEDRKARLTVHSARMGDAVLSKDGEKLYYLASFEKGLNLWSTNLRTKETRQEVKLDARSASLQWDKDMKNLFLLADGKISKIDVDKVKSEPVPVKGEMQTDLLAEKRASFNHVVERTRKGFYTDKYHNANWNALADAYGKYLPDMTNGYDFAEMLSELLGELNVSHATARYSQPAPDGDITASLGIFMDYSHKGDGIKVAEVITGGPLDKAGVNVPVGSVIEKIDGETVLASQDVARYLNRKAGRFTLIEVYNPQKNTREAYTVKPITLAEENGLLYQRWVKANNDEVVKRSNGTLGYVHVPGMADGPFRTVFDDMMGKHYDKNGIIVDTRFNGGGDLVSDLAMFFTGQQFLDYRNMERSLGIEPTSRWTKPTLAMFNEANYSDGSCFAGGYQDLKIGKTVGMPTPGTCSFAGWEALPDGVRWGMVPVSAVNNRGQWLENVETIPDFQVKNEPLIIANGRDQQLEKAIEVLQQEVNK